MPHLGIPELLLILLLVIVIFGAGKLPQLGKGLGEGIRNFLLFNDAATPEKKDDDSKDR